MAGKEGFEPPRAVKPLLVFKTSPFSQTWVFALIWWSHQDLNLEPTGYEPGALTNWAIGPSTFFANIWYGSTKESRTLDLSGMNRTL